MIFQPSGSRRRRSAIGAGDDVRVASWRAAPHVLGVQVALALGVVAMDVDDEVPEQVLAGVERVERTAAHVDEGVRPVDRVHPLVVDGGVVAEARPQELPVAPVEGAR